MWEKPLFEGFKALLCGPEGKVSQNDTFGAAITACSLSGLLISSIKKKWGHPR